MLPVKGAKEKDPKNICPTAFKTVAETLDPFHGPGKQSGKQMYNIYGFKRIYPKKRGV